MSAKNIFIVFFIFFAAKYAAAQNKIEKDTPLENFESYNKSSDNIFSGNLNLDNNISFDAVQENMISKNLNINPADKKSPWLGTLFSVILPGAGEFYAESYWKAGIFVAIEAAVVTTAVIYNKKGNDETTTFQNYANSHWSAVRYAEWLVRYAQSEGQTVTIDDDRVRQGDYSQIHAVENLFSNLSHNLAPFGDQQYFEMIGKYDQFAGGWDDFNPQQLTTTPISPNFNYYSGLRGKANDYFAVASTAVIGIYINHFLSAIDAYWSTTVYNKELAVNMSVENKRFADNIILVPTLNFKLSF